MRRYFIYREKKDNLGTGHLVVNTGFDTVKQARKKQEYLEKSVDYNYHFLVQDEPAPRKVTLQGGQDVQVTKPGSSQ